MRALRPRPVRTACLMHSALITGSMPGMAASTSDTCELGSPPKAVDAPENRTSNGNFGAFLGALIAIVVIVFLLNGGEYVGKKTVDGDADLPPVATGTGSPK